jgi:hypothetical protein
VVQGGNSWMKAMMMDDEAISMIVVSIKQDNDSFCC